jgi:hypothetical protein
MKPVRTHRELFQAFDPPYERFDHSMLGPHFAAELDLVSRLWFRCGYRPGIGDRKCREAFPPHPEDRRNDRRAVRTAIDPAPRRAVPVEA